jgi:hypothetical protein
MAYLDPSLRRRRRSIAAQLRRVERDLALLDELESVRRAPADAPSPAGRPLLGRRGLSALRIRLAEELAALDEASLLLH